MDHSASVFFRDNGLHPLLFMIFVVLICVTAWWVRRDETDFLKLGIWISCLNILSYLIIDRAFVLSQVIYRLPKDPGAPAHVAGSVELPWIGSFFVVAMLFYLFALVSFLYLLTRRKKAWKTTALLLFKIALVAQIHSLVLTVLFISRTKYLSLAYNVAELLMQFLVVALSLFFFLTYRSRSRKKSES